MQNFFSWALLRSASSSEATYWNDILRAAYANGQGSIVIAAREMGRTLFESSEYAARARSDQDYVYDLYKTYLMREPDSQGWADWTAAVPLYGRDHVRRGFDESSEFINLMGTLTPNGGITSGVSSLLTARTSAENEPGAGVISRAAEWNLPLLGLPGRAGLDLGLTLSYSSLVWTRSGPYLYFDEDNGSPSPGFRLGFPTIQEKYFDAQVGRNVYVMITSAGRVELRQVGSSTTYEAADSSYLQLIEQGNLLVRATDGTQLTYGWFNSREFRCISIKDRNGNFLTVNYNWLGQITNITDTLGRIVTFNYDGNANLLSITQTWNGQTHQWATFSWGTHTMQSSFSGASVVGAPNGTVMPVFTQVGLHDGSYFTFQYTNAAQVSIIRSYRSDNVQRAYTAFDYDAPAGDAPRLLAFRVWAENWTGTYGVPAEVVTQYSVAGDGACVLTAPDGTVFKQYYGTGWQKGLTTQSEVWSGGVRRKWITTAWTQDNTSVNYELNPRVTETNVYDAEGNRRRVVVNYGAYAAYGLPYEILEYAANGVTPLRSRYFDYNLSGDYVNRRIIGLVSEIHDVDHTLGIWVNKTTFSYDWGGEFIAAPAQAATQHDATNYGASFVTGRGNVSAVWRWDVTDIINPAKAIPKVRTGYSTTGSPLFSRDGLGHQTTLSYTDGFSDNINRNAFAYPTNVTDADGFSSSVQYHFDFGARTRVQGPPPDGQSQGAIQTFTYDGAGRIQQTTTVNNGAYTRYVYGPNYVQSYGTVNSVADDAYSCSILDGAGRAILLVNNHPGSAGGYAAQHMIYDLMGRAVKQSNPTEITGGWSPTGDDAAGWLYTQQTYDWQSRPLVTTNTDGTTKEASYSGCGCAGGEVVTLTDEGTIDAGVFKRRQQKIYADILGRTIKTEVLNWQGGSIYAATVNTYNVRDQLTQVRQYAGPEGSGTYQDTTMSFDGYGRLLTKHVPEQNAGTATVYSYNLDDTIQSVTDARGASATYSYNARHLVTAINYSAPSGITPTSNVSFGYDPAGNRTSMTDGVGSHSYNYDQLSRMTSETQSFTGFAGSYSLSYGYNLADQLTSLAEPPQFGATINYAHDSSGRLTAVTGSGGLSAQLLTGMQYRAWGGLKHASYGDGPQVNVTYNARLLPTRYELNNVYIAPLITPGYYTVGTENQYHPDGRLHYARDLQDDHYDRAFTFDHAGRLKEAYTGREARGLAPTWPEDSPYRQSYSYDAWNNMGRTGRHWTLAVSDTPTYTNNRRPDWSYDASGNVTLREGGQRTHAYDAAGQQRHFYEAGTDMWGSYWLWHQYTINQSYDGDGRAGKRIETRYSEDENGPVENSTETSYQLRSSVLGGALIAEISEWGSREGYVYAEGELIARYGGTGGNTFTTFQHRNPTTGQWVKSGFRTELDPLGADVGYTSPYAYNMTYSDIMGSDNLYSIRGNALDIRGGCALDGMSVSCSFLNEMMEAGWVEAEFPDITINGRNGRVTARQPIRSHGIGLFSVYLPDGSRGNDLQWDLRLFVVLQNPLGNATQPQRARATPTPNPCSVAIPTNSNDRAVLAMLLGEASTPGENTWSSDQSGVGAYRNPSGTLSEENVYDEMLQMVAVVDHRLTDWGQSEGYSNWQDVVQAPGQFLGYGNGQNILQNLGAEGSGNCIRARLGVAAIKAFHDSPWTSRFYYWKGIKQENRRGQMFIRARNGAWRWANTDFQIRE